MIDARFAMHMIIFRAHLDALPVSRRGGSGLDIRSGTLGVNR